jgi:hypothetical protein
MIPMRRFSIGLLMAVIFFVAADFAIVRALWDTNEPLVVAVITLPMINLLLMVLPGARRGRDRRPFWLGFEAAGWMMVVLFASLAWFFVDTFFYPIEWIDNHDSLLSGSPTETAFLICCCVVIYTPPQVLGAMVGGWLSAGYRLVIERR